MLDYPSLPTIPGGTAFGSRCGKSRDMELIPSFSALAFVSYSVCVHCVGFGSRAGKQNSKECPKVKSYQFLREITLGLDLTML